MLPARLLGSERRASSDRSRILSSLRRMRANRATYALARFGWAEGGVAGQRPVRAARRTGRQRDPGESHELHRCLSGQTEQLAARLRPPGGGRYSRRQQHEPHRAVTDLARRLGRHLSDLPGAGPGGWRRSPGRCHPGRRDPGQAGHRQHVHLDDRQCEWRRRSRPYARTKFIRQPVQLPAQQHWPVWHVRRHELRRRRHREHL